MDYLAYNSRKRLKTQDYQNNVISIPLKKTKPGLNSYSHYLIPSSKGYINSLRDLIFLFNLRSILYVLVVIT